MSAFDVLVDAVLPDMKATLAKLIEILGARGVRYVIGGANALALYVKPRMTVDIDAFVDPDRKDDLDRLLAERFELVHIGRFHSKFKDGEVEIDIRYAGARTEDFALANSRDAVILGTRVKAASPEALLWLYLVSDKEQNFVDALELIRALPGLDLALVRREVERHDPALLANLEAMLERASEPPSSYDASREGGR
ncbi:MAG: hypothetical protein A3G83_13265 [Betaproteobacteria bacterium RIFCSPLOWO2_12_FULL_68_20]|nr:MAG: hypothetical protein A3G83_13265 [Betaproteobacteria bacterium RIFCSPLOWO2_12_FULL_68_20]